MSTPEWARWGGWMRFAAFIVLINGIFGLLQGIVAIFAPDGYFVLSKGGLFIFDLTGWGWWNLVFGLLLVLTGGALFSGATWARVVAVILAILNAIGQLLLLPAQPWWSTIIIVLDMLVIFAVTVHGREARSAG
ncbi:hypothetical protein [Leifsonia sp. NPDC058230]|uniref:DUF7144 family membrane protein n=1 Tax=Leifsonia sp. NPDC058230 TaxID=3346391 RepID=UPI0036DD2B1F